MAKNKSSRAKSGARKKKTMVKDLAPKKSARGGLTQTSLITKLNPGASGNTIGSALGTDSIRSR